MDVTDDGLVQEIQHLSVCVLFCFFFFSPNGIFLKRDFCLSGTDWLSLICSICCFLAESPALFTTDIVDTQNEIHYHYSHSPRSRVIATVKEAAVAALLCLQ